VNKRKLKKIKSSSYSLNTLSGVTSGKVAAVASRWQRVGDLIGYGYEHHTSRTRSEPTTCANVTFLPPD